MKKNTYNRGQAVMVGVIFFIFTSLSIVLSLSSGIVSGLRVAREGLVSQDSYYAAESGLEDAIYRIKTGKNISGVELLTVGSTTATTTIIDLGNGQKQITSSSTAKLIYTRKIQAIINSLSSVPFIYSVQVGQGGFNLSGNATVNGNIYTSGNVTGVSGGGEVINGNVTAANSSSFTLATQNGTLSVPPNSITIGGTSNPDIAQAFTVSSTTPLNKIELYLKKTGSPGNLTVRLMSGSSTSTQPGSTEIANTTLSSATTTTSYGWKGVLFSPTPTLVEDTPYWIVVDGGSSSSNYYTIGAVSGYSGGVADVGTHNTSWSGASGGVDMYFKVYTGGFTSTVNLVTVNAYGATGSTGDVWAHSVTNSTLQGTLSCQSGSSNNKSCSVVADPDPQPMPITDAHITKWEADALSGGTYGSTNLSLANNDALSLGPKVINGNLTVGGNAVLTLTGAVYVKGTVSVSGNGVIRLASSYGANDGVLITDNPLTLTGNSAFQGSGTTGSYIVLLTTSTAGASGCVSPYAISLSGNAGAVILAAPGGAIQLTSNASINNAVAYRMCIDSNASVSYDSGKASTNIDTGVTGQWSINSWQEIQ